MRRFGALGLALLVAASGCGTYGAWSKRREARALERSIEEQREKLSGMSAAELARAEAESREKAIAQYEKILEEYADVGRDEMDEALYLLGRLLFDREQGEFQRKQASFEDLQRRAEAAGAAPPEEPRPRYPGARAVYERLLREFPESSLREDALYDLAYVLYEEGSHDRAIGLFEQLVRETPGSRYAAEVHFRLGEHRFESYDLAGAEKEYRAVLRLGSSDLTGKALFKLGWVYYNLDRFDEAKTVLTDLLQREVQQVELEGREYAPTPTLFFPAPRRPVLKDFDLQARQSDLYQEALEIIARVYSESGGADALLRFIRSQDAGRRPPPYAAPLMHRLALVEKERAQFTAAARAYELLLESFPAFQRAPEVELDYVQVLIDQKDLDRAAAVREAMLEKYDTDSPWARDNPDPEAREAALKAARKGLSWSIRHWHAKGLELQEEKGGVPQELRRAITLYEKYLERFPEGKTAYLRRFRYAQALYAAGDYLKSADVFRQVAFDPELDTKREEAAFARILCVEELLKTRSGPLPPESADRLVAAFEDYIALNPDTERAPALLFKEGQIYFEAERYSSAITAFQRLVEGYPDNPLAAEARDLVAQAHFRGGDFPLTEDWADRALRVTGPESPPERREQVENLYALSVFRQGEQAEKEGDLDAARGHYLRLVDRIPSSEVAPRALYNAAAAADQAGDSPQAAQLFERLLADYVSSDLATDAAVRLAKFYENEPGGSERLLRLYERVADHHVESPHAEEFLFLAASRAVKEKRRTESIRLFEKYLSRYRATAPPERTQTALYHLGTTYADSGSPQLARLSLGQFLALPRPAKASFGEAGEGYAAAEARAELVLARMVDEEYRRVRIEPPIEQSFPRKQKLLERVVEQYAGPVASGLSPIATEASYRIGAAYEEFGRALEEAPRPPGLTPEEEAEYEQLLQEQIRPFLRKAVEAHRVTVRAAREKSITDEWVDRSGERLPLLAPRAFLRAPRPQYARLPSPSGEPPPILRTLAGATVSPSPASGFFGSIGAGDEETRRRAFAAGLDAALASPPDWAAAAGYFDKAAAGGPPEAGFNAAVAAVRAGDLASAEASIEDVARRFPAFEPAEILAAWVHERRGKHDLAASEYRRAAQSAGAPAAWRVSWGRFLEGQGRETEALAAYHLALEADPNDPEAHLGIARLGGTATPAGLEALLAPLSGRPALLVELGVLAAERGALRVAAEAFGAARSAIPPGDREALAVVLNDEALAAVALGEIRRAEGLLTQAVEADPGLSPLLNTAGILRMQQGDFERAETEFRKAVEGPEASAPAWANLGILNELYFGLPEAALECYNRYLATRPHDESVVAGWIREIREGMS